MPRRNENSQKHMHNHSREEIKYQEARHAKKRWNKFKTFRLHEHELPIHVDNIVANGYLTMDEAHEIFGDEPIVFAHPEEIKKKYSKKEIRDKLEVLVPALHAAVHKGGKEYFECHCDLCNWVKAEYSYKTHRAHEKQKTMREDINPYLGPI